MAAETQYTVNMGLVTISTANANKDGTGTLGDVITGASNGTVVKQLFIKAQTNTSLGMLRLYTYNGATTGLLAEIEVPAVTKSATNQSFGTYLELDLFLQSGDVLKASTEKAETFNIIAVGLDVSYNTISAKSDTTQYEAKNGLGKLSAANSNLDGTGTIVSLIQASTVGSGWLGQKIEKIHLKATGTTTSGMLRLFVQNSEGTVTKLFAEIPVPAVTPTATALSFEQVLNFNNFYLQTGYRIMGATQNAESFVVTAEAMNFKYSS